ncbi:hypothetical protein N7532_009600 [Penicillium argentinense]|uniref:ASST-domain-containing protein n=1 Tax=Penicillium argentinense TaxID=1131581 RepID=A0A9W9K341_9EURO|nr:uncharacterized protein N7532_009600 [Penicillium argentinense]KAJ5090916.1 hypothetical protein N7532_009600 [Penicillium argentinense]
MLFLGGLICLFLHGAAAERQDEDLFSFVTLPEVRAPRFEVTHIDRDRQLPGYWFIAPYGQINPEEPTQKYMQYQVGPYIYDNEGELIWAGSPMTDNRNVFDFKANWNVDENPHLSFILQHDYNTDSDKGSGMILGSDYNIEHHVGVLNDLSAFNMHEFNILDGGKTGLACTYRSQLTDLDDFDRPDEESWVVTGGFVELDVESSAILFEWDSFDKISLSESVVFHAWDGTRGEPGWDYVHINSVDKNGNGDYLISMRFTNTIYMISGTDGEIMWRLGGIKSDFDMDFTFSKQHDVKFVESNGTHHVISIMNNASDESENDEDISSALFIELDTDASPMTATVIRRIDRPDGELTRLRGNVQQLPNGNSFIGWSKQGYHSEHAPNGDILLSARFSSDRFSSYRSYKFDWIGRPSAPPDLVASVYGTSEEDMMTVIYVSWNGATDVAVWEFYARSFDHGKDVLIGSTNKTSFETMYIAEGFMDWITAKAVDEDGNALSTSTLYRTDIPESWKSSGFDQSLPDPSPDDPEILQAIQEKVESGDYGDVKSSSATAEGRKAAVYAATKEVAQSVYKAYGMIRLLENIVMFVLAVCCVGGILAGVWHFVRRRKLRSYQHVPSDEAPAEEVNKTLNGNE